MVTNNDIDPAILRDKWLTFIDNIVTVFFFIADSPSDVKYFRKFDVTTAILKKTSSLVYSTYESHENILIHSILSVLKDGINENFRSSPKLGDIMKSISLRDLSNYDYGKSIGIDYFDFTCEPDLLHYNVIMYNLFDYCPNNYIVFKLMCDKFIPYLEKSNNGEIKQIFNIFHIEFNFKNLLAWFVKLRDYEYMKKSLVTKTFNICFKHD